MERHLVLEETRHPAAARGGPGALEAEERGRVIIVGDVHGCYEEMRLLLTECSFDEDKDLLIFVGDLVNKGPASVEVVRFVRSLALRGIAYSVLGNHDEALLEKVEISPNLRPQKYSYIEELLRSVRLLVYPSLLSKDCSEEIEWLRSLPYTIRLPGYNSLVVHAGLLPNVPLGDQQSQHMTKMRNLIYPPGFNPLELTEVIPEAVETSKQGGVPWAEAWQGPEHIYFGHDARRGLQLCRFATGLDTGCCYGRQLSAAILPENRIVQVSALSKHAPCGVD
jgi:diadenosine tetraphosphatase ApaH/serine/threonine PP2A family protein phosphatase